MKEKFIKSSIILIIGGFITKILGIINKIIMTRLLKTEGVGLYMLILPTFSLFINLASFGFPIAVSKLVAEDDKNNKKLVFSVVPFSLIINIFLIFLIIIFAPYLSHNLLKEDRIYYAVMAISLVIPFTSISSILRSYFFGKEKMFPHVVSNILEDIVRLFLIIAGIPIFLKKGVEYAIFYLVASNVISELASILVLFLFLPKNFKLTKNDIKPSKVYLRDSLEISVPTTISRLIGSVTYFLEPIILTSILLYTGYSRGYITTEYGIISGYVMPIIMLPSFFSNAISQALLPIVSKSYKRKNYSYTKKKIKQAIMISLGIGIVFTISFIIVPDTILKLIYNTTEGATYLKYFAPVCLLQYIVAPLTMSLDAMGKSKDNLIVTIVISIIRTIALPLLALLKIGIWSLIISTSINIVVDTIMSLKRVKKALNT